MEVLIVDDQSSVVNGIERGIHWESLGISRVWKAYNAMEAKIIISNENIQIVLCDIEMPGEDGLSLCRWIRERNYDIECILLTAHAEFAFAREALSLGIFDYILQPARYEEIEEVLKRVLKQIDEKSEIKKNSDIGKLFNSKKQILLADILKRMVFGAGIDRKRIFDELRALGYVLSEKNKMVCFQVEILQWKENTKKLDNTLFSFVTGNIVQELLEKYSIKVLSACLENDVMSGFIIGTEETMPGMEKIKHTLTKYLNLDYSQHNRVSG